MTTRFFDRDGKELSKPVPEPDIPILLQFGGPFDEVRVTLSFCSPSLDKLEVSAITDLCPTKAWNAHERHVHGNGMSGQTREVDFGKWFHTVDLDSADPNELIEHLFATATRDLTGWTSLAQRNDGRVTIAGHLDNWNRELDLSPVVLKLLAERALRLTVDVYFDGDEIDDDESAQQDGAAQPATAGESK
ncbi:MAG TPA: hypothetical protein VMP01_15755 [Pirellulaceae bacterium]|nr:hypothetical protein [Pirellulaceae bacterium]